VVLQHGHEVQFKVPGTQEVNIEKPGRYYLWNDFRTVYAGKSYDQSEHIPGGMQIEIRDADGNLLPFTSDISMSSIAEGSAKNVIGYVEVKKPGRMKIDVSGGSDERVFSLGPTNSARIFLLLLGGFGLSALVGLAGFGLGIWGIIKLVRSNKQDKTIHGNLRDSRLHSL